MSDEGQELRREYMRVYMRNWRRNNKEKIRQYNSAYWNKRANVQVRGLDSLVAELEELKRA